MENTHAIKARIKSVESIQQITKSMKMVSAAKLRRVQAARGALGVMADKSREILEELVNGELDGDNPFIARRETKHTCFVLFIGNRGFCGGYNTAILHFLEERMTQCGNDCSAVICGSWGRELMESAGIKIRKRFPELNDVPTADEAKMLSEYLKDLYRGGEADEIVLVYQQYKSVMLQNPLERQLLPIQTDTAERKEAVYIFEPDRKSIVAALVEMYINNTVFSVMLEARTGEHAARMSSMTAASDSTDELLGELKLSLNHARQAAITTELSEIVGGNASMKGND